MEVSTTPARPGVMDPKSHCYFSSLLCRWLEMLMVYPRTNKQNQKKKRKVEPPTAQVGWLACPLVELALGGSEVRAREWGKVWLGLRWSQLACCLLPPVYTLVVIGHMSFSLNH